MELSKTDDGTSVKRWVVRVTGYAYVWAETEEEAMESPAVFDNFNIEDLWAEVLTNDNRR